MARRVPIIHCPLEQCPLGKRALRFEQTGRYSGWTGYQEFGVITKYRYYGWCVTCWSTVMARAYDIGWARPCFDRFDKAVVGLFCLMDLAEQTGELEQSRRSFGLKRNQRMSYFRMPEPKSGSVYWFTSYGLRCIGPRLETNSRMLYSPAYEQHYMRQVDPNFVSTKPYRSSLHPPIM